MFDAEVFAIYKALGTIEQSEQGRRYTIPVETTSAITRVRDDDKGPGQPFAMAAIEVYSRITSNDNNITI